MKLPFEPTVGDLEPKDASGKLRRINAAAALEHLVSESRVIESIPVASVVLPPSIRSLAGYLNVTAPALYGKTGFGDSFGDALHNLTGLVPVKTGGIVLVEEGASVIDYTEASAQPDVPSLEGLSPDQLLAVIDDAATRLGAHGITS